MTVEFKDIVQIIQAVAWPALVAVALLVFHKPLGHFLEELGQRATKVSVFQFAIELATVPEFKPGWSGPALSDVRQLSPADEFSSAAMALFEQISSDTASDYAIVDLGTGHQWLTSRLFIFAIMLERMRGLQCFVFLETSGDVRRRFLGTASPNEVRWALARRYPWLETAFATAYSQPNNLPNLQIRSVHGALEPWVANETVKFFLSQIQQKQPPDADQSEWVSLDHQPLWEHAKWLDGARLERILGDALHVSWVLDSLDAPPGERTRAVLRRAGPFVALVEEGRIFESLVDRQALVEQVVKRVAAPAE